MSFFDERFCEHDFAQGCHIAQSFLLKRFNLPADHDSFGRLPDADANGDAPILRLRGALAEPLPKPI
jgi:hypothetical protein